MSGLVEIHVCDSKYTFVVDNGTDNLVEILRYGESWSRRIEQDGQISYHRAIGALATELADARAEILRLRALTDPAE